MSSRLKPIVYVLGLLIVLVVGLYVYRTVMLWDGRTPEGYKLLTAMPDAMGFEPTDLPKGPVLENQSTSDLAVNFGYRVGDIPYSYSLVLAFAPQGMDGHATVTARHSTRSASVETATVRRWDAPRKAYAVALHEKFNIQPTVPSLCIKAVIGPDPSNYDLKDGSICVAQRGTNGDCHAETLACGLIRQ